MAGTFFVCEHLRSAARTARAVVLLGWSSIFLSSVAELIRLGAEPSILPQGIGSRRIFPGPKSNRRCTRGSVPPIRNPAYRQELMNPHGEQPARGRTSADRLDRPPYGLVYSPIGLHMLPYRIECP